MSAPRLDGPGAIKMQTLEEALTQTQRLHGLVERMAVAMRANQSTADMARQFRRAATPLVGLLKGQFGMISDYAAAIILAATRGGGDQMRLRALREGVAQLRMQLEVAVAKVKEQHAVDRSATSEHTPERTPE